MEGPQFPKTPEEVVTALAELLEHQAEKELVSIIRSAKPNIKHAYDDTWNEGTSYYTLASEIAPLKGQSSILLPIIDIFIVVASEVVLSVNATLT